MMQTIKLIEIGKSIKSKNGLNNINIEFKSDKVNGLLGPNGSGKTTLFNIIAGFTSIGHGSIHTYFLFGIPRVQIQTNLLFISVRP